MGLIAVKLIIPCCLLIFWPAVSGAQSQAGAITGTIVDRSGVPAAVVEVAGPGPRLTFSTSTDGQFRFAHLPPGVYDLAASKLGFQPAKRTGLVVHVGETLAVSLMLDVEALRQSVDVSPSRTSANSILSTTQDEVARIPMWGMWQRCSLPFRVWFSPRGTCQARSHISSRSSCSAAAACWTRHGH